MKQIHSILITFVICFSLLLCGCRENGEYDIYVNIASSSVSQEVSIAYEPAPIYSETDGISSDSTVESSSMFEVSSSLSSIGDSDEILSSESEWNETPSISSETSNNFSSQSASETSKIIVVVQSSESSSSTSESSAPNIVVIVSEQSTNSSESSSSETSVKVPESSTADPLGGNNDPPAISVASSEYENSSNPVESTFSSSSSANPKIDPHEYDGEVYVASSGKGKKFHLTPTCSGMKNPVSMTVQEAETKGYTPCQKCWGKDE